RDNKVRRAVQNADADGRIQLELDGEEYEVGISTAGVHSLSGYRLEGAGWATPKKPIKLRARIWNKGGGPLPSQPVRWETSNPNVTVQAPAAAIPPLAAGASAEVAVIVNVFDETREVVKIHAVVGGRRLPLEIPLLPDMPPTAEFRVADGKTFSVFQHAIEKGELSLGKGNGDGRVNGGETIAILLPDAGAYRAAELFTNDSCVDNTIRASDSWSAYDHVGASAKYGLPAIKRGCPAGHVIHFMARVQLPDKPNHKVRYAAVDVAVK
ncbi:MAG: hypothetical protein ABIZ80_08575, partial [Bryobacteraceae bacterium]